MDDNRSKFSCSGSLVCLVFLLLFASTTCADQHRANRPHIIEMFTLTQYTIVESSAEGSGLKLQGYEITVYEMDGIQSVERNLSFNLSAEPWQSQQVALQRIQNMDEQTRLKMQSAATGLAKAIQYGVDRLPAIVIDGEAVMYDVTNLAVALEQYRAWKTGKRP